MEEKEVSYALYKKAIKEATIEMVRSCLARRGQN